MITFDQLKFITIPFDISTLKISIVVIKATDNEALKEKHKLKIFQMFGRVVITKQINNFFALIKHKSNTDDIITKNGLIAEAWIVLDRCLEKCELSRAASFLYYYNTALDRHFSRLRNNLFKNNKKTVYIIDHFAGEEKNENNESVILSRLIGESSNFDNNNFHLLLHQMVKEWGFSIDEIRVTTSRMSKQRVNDFLKDNFDIDQNKYYSILESIRKKLKENNIYNELAE